MREKDALIDAADEMETEEICHVIDAFHGPPRCCVETDGEFVAEELLTEDALTEELGDTETDADDGEREDDGEGSAAAKSVSAAARTRVEDKRGRRGNLCELFATLCFTYILDQSLSVFFFRRRALPLFST